MGFQHSCKPPTSRMPQKWGLANLSPCNEQTAAKKSPVRWICRITDIGRSELRQHRGAPSCWQCSTSYLEWGTVGLLAPQNTHLRDRWVDWGIAQQSGSTGQSYTMQKRARGLSSGHKSWLSPSERSTSSVEEAPPQRGSANPRGDEIGFRAVPSVNKESLTCSQEGSLQLKLPLLLLSQ